MKNVKAQLIISESVQGQQVGNRSDVFVVNPLMGLFLPYIPSAASFGITAIVYFSEPLDRMNLEIRVLNGFELAEDESNIIFSTGSSPIEAPDKKAPHSNFTLNIDVRNVGIPNEGNYVVQCIVDGKIVEEQNFFIYRANIEDESRTNN